MHEPTPSPDDRSPLRLGLHDLAVRLRSDAPALRWHAAETLRYKGAEPLAGAVGGAVLELALSARLPDEPRPADAQDVGVLDEDVRIYRTGDRLVAHGPDLYACVVLGARRATVAYRGAVQENEPTPMRLFYAITFAVTTLLRAEGLVGLHAAALARDGRGLLLIAESDSGKSTASFTLVRQGWQHVTDDALLLRREGDRVVGLSFRRDFCVDPDAADRFPELRAHAWPPSPSDPSKWRVDLARLYPGRHAARCVPAVLLFPAIVPEAVSRIRPMTRHEAFQRIMVQSGHGLLTGTDELQRHMRLVAGLLEQVAVYRLDAGRDVLEAPERFSARLGEVLGETLASPPSS